LIIESFNILLNQWITILNFDESQLCNRLDGMMSTTALAVRSMMILLDVSNNVGRVKDQTEQITST
jgi:hypothetical protein